MTNEEREALIAQGWTPPKVADPDVELARRYVDEMFSPLHILDVVNLATKHRALDYVLGAIKEGRALAAAEAKPGLVWKRHDQTNMVPFEKGSMVIIERVDNSLDVIWSGNCKWIHVAYYAEITLQEDQ